MYLRVPTRKTGMQRRTLGWVKAWLMVVRIVELGVWSVDCGRGVVDDGNVGGDGDLGCGED